jgi:hypothetical protein
MRHRMLFHRSTVDSAYPYGAPFLKLKRFAMNDVWLELQQVFAVFWIVTGSLVIFACEFLDALVTVPFGYRPKMTPVAFDAAQNFHAQISFGFLVIGHPSFDHVFEIFVGVCTFGQAVPNSRDHFTFHNWLLASYLSIAVSETDDIYFPASLQVSPPSQNPSEAVPWRLQLQQIR